VDQLDIPGTEHPPKKKRGRPRKYSDADAKRQAQVAARREQRRAAREKLKALADDPQEVRRRAVQARMQQLAPKSPDLDVRDDDLKEIAAQFPNVAEALQYVRDVLTERLPACQWVRLACERHDRDVARIESADYPYTFDARKAERALRAIQMFREIRGPRAGKRFRFGPWQKFLVGSMFGWVSKETGQRRFRYVFLAVPRGNGKSSLAATIALYMLALDGEGGAEVYAAAVTRDQARIVFNLAQHMARQDGGFRSRYGVEIAAHVVTQPATASIFRPLSRDANTLDGLNVHLAVLDELAAHKSREVHDVLVTASGKRSQPLVLSITTAGNNQSGIGYEQWRYAQRVLLQETQDDAFLGIIYTVDDADDWQDPASWAKANPNWGVSVYPDSIATLAHRAAQIASQQNAFKQKHLNLWTNASVSWMNMIYWDACADPALTENDFKGEQCVLGLDLAAKIDLAARVKLFARTIEGVVHYYVFAQFYLPEATLFDGRNASYGTWHAENWITGTPGEVIDFDRIVADILQDATDHQILDVAYDPWQALKLASELAQKDIPVIEYRPTVANFSPAMKEIDALVRQRRLHHNGNPVLRWNIGCVEVAEDFKGNIFPRKDRDNPLLKIDGLIALLMAMGRRMVLESEGSSEPTLTFV
jgi:phage terminase large subunit-like protein